MRCVLESITHGDESRGPLARRRRELLRGARPHVTGGEHAVHRRLEAAVRLDEPPAVELDGPLQERRVRIEADEDEDASGLPAVLLAAGAVAGDDFRQSR